MQIVFSCYILLECVLNHHRQKNMHTPRHSCDTVTEDKMCCTYGRETQLTHTPKWCHMVCVPLQSSALSVSESQKTQMSLNLLTHLVPYTEYTRLHNDVRDTLLKSKYT